MTASCIERKSSFPQSPRMRSLRYSDLSGQPLVKATAEATVSLPCVCEMSKQTMKRGTAESSSTSCSS